MDSHSLSPNRLVFLLLLTAVFCVSAAPQPARLDSLQRALHNHVRRSVPNTALSSCAIQPVSFNETVQTLVDLITMNYTTLLRISIFVEGNIPRPDAGPDLIQPNVWIWAPGQRGKTLLSFPYNFESLSLNTLRPGIRNISINFQDTNPGMNNDTDICLFRALEEIVLNVKMSIEESSGSEPTTGDAVICKEKLLRSPSFSGTYIPGYSLFELQVSSYYDCYTRIYSCYLVNILFGVTYGVLLLLIGSKFWRIWAYPQKIFNLDDEDGRGQERDGPLSGVHVLGKGNQDSEDSTVNILRINLIPPVLIILALNDQKHQKLFHIFYWGIIYTIPLIIYIIAVICHAAVLEEYNQRRMLLGNSYMIREILLDHIFANVLYIIGVSLFFYYLYKYDLDDEKNEQAYDWQTKKRKMCFYICVTVLCFFRLSATTLLLSEILVMTVVGIAINFEHIYPAWLNIVIGGIVYVIYIVGFFDNYQQLFNRVYTVGSKIDRDDLPHKIFPKKEDADPDRGLLLRNKFEISTSLLQAIIKKRLPLHIHLMKTFTRLLIASIVLIVIAVVVVVIDKQTDLPKTVEYLITAGSLLFAASGKVKNNPCSSGGKEKNRYQDKILSLEDDLREFAQTGIFPPPSPPFWRSGCGFSRCWPWCGSPCCRHNSDGNQSQMQADDQPAVAADFPKDRTDVGHDAPSSDSTSSRPPLSSQAPHVVPAGSEPSASIATSAAAADRSSRAASSLSTSAGSVPKSPASPLTPAQVSFQKRDALEDVSSL